MQATTLNRTFLLTIYIALLSGCDQSADNTSTCKPVAYLTWLKFSSSPSPQTIAVGGELLFTTNRCPNQIRLGDNTAFSISPWPQEEEPDNYVIHANAISAPHDLVFYNIDNPDIVSDPTAIAAAEIDHVRIESFWDDYLPDQEFALLRREDAGAIVALYGSDQQPLYDATMDVSLSCAENLARDPTRFSDLIALWDVLHISGDTENCMAVKVTISAGHSSYDVILPVVDEIEDLTLAKPIFTTDEGKERLCLRATTGERAVLGLAFNAAFDGVELESARGGDNCFFLPPRDGAIEINVSAGGHSQLLALAAP